MRQSGCGHQEEQHGILQLCCIHCGFHCEHTEQIHGIHLPGLHIQSHKQGERLAQVHHKLGQVCMLEQGLGHKLGQVLEHKQVQHGQGLELGLHEQ